MKSSTRACIIVSIITAVFTLLSAIFLPDTVRVQHSEYTGVSTDLPKIWGILLAAVLSIAGAVGVLLSKKPEPRKNYPLTISVIGIILFIYMFFASFSI